MAAVALSGPAGWSRCAFVVAVHRLRASWGLNGLPGQQELRLFVDDVDLVELVGVVELPDAQHEGHPNIAGDYAGLDAWRLRGKIAEHFLGGPDSHMFCGPRDKTLLLGCGCGEPGCWPLMARVETTADEVRWSAFEQPHRRDRWSHDALGPFVFDRCQYETRSVRPRQICRPVRSPTALRPGGPGDRRVR